MLDYLKMTISEIGELDREKTIFLMALSPVEAHGPHLPMGTDLYVAEELQRRYAAALQAEYPAYTLVRLPTLQMGADALPAKGSLNFPASLLKKTLRSLAGELAGQGFRYLFLSDNHGGPRHLLAIETAARQVWKKYRFAMVNPFGLVYRMMVEQDGRLLQETGLAAGSCGDDSDAHGGTNETSLMLAAGHESLIKGHQEVPFSQPPPPQKGTVLLAKLLGIFSKELRADFEHLARVLGWVQDREMSSYLGDPARACSINGEAMLSFHLEIAMELFRSSLDGKPVPIQPLLWKVRFLQYLP